MTVIEHWGSVKAWVFRCMNVYARVGMVGMANTVVLTQIKMVYPTATFHATQVIMSVEQTTVVTYPTVVRKMQTVME
jgi:predicted MarR family transcription regulator